MFTVSQEVFTDLKKVSQSPRKCSRISKKKSVTVSKEVFTNIKKKFVTVSQEVFTDIKKKCHSLPGSVHG